MIVYGGGLVTRRKRKLFLSIDFLFRVRPSTSTVSDGVGENKTETSAVLIVEHVNDICWTGRR